MSPSVYGRLVLLLSLLPLLTIAVTGWLYVGKVGQGQTADIVQNSSQNLAKDPRLTQDNSYLGTGQYATRDSSKSQITKDDFGYLFLMNNQASKVSFVVAGGKGNDLSNESIAPGWKVVRVGKDPMWIPGACATKPSYLVNDKYVFMDDGDYSGGPDTAFISRYDTKTQTFTVFGGALATPQQKQEKILKMNVEDGMLVMYLDTHDKNGPYQTSSYKHLASSHSNDIIRRVIHADTMKYDDYRSPFTAPGFERYTLGISGSGTHLNLLIASEGRVNYKAGALTKNGTTLKDIDSKKLSQINEGITKTPTDSLAKNIQKALNLSFPSFYKDEQTPLQSYTGEVEKLDDASYQFSLSSAPANSTVGIYNDISKTVTSPATSATIGEWSNFETFILGYFRG